MPALARASRLLVAVVTLVAAATALAGPAGAVPTASFTYAPSAPEVGDPVTLTFTGTCDLPPCTVLWRSFVEGGSSTGTVLGTGTRVVTAFADPGAYSVTADVTNSGSTHGSATATQVVVVSRTHQDATDLAHDGWASVADAGARGGSYHRTPAVTATGTAIARAVVRGTSVTYVARTGPDLGVARLSVDGVRRGRLDLYAAVPGERTLTAGGLADGPHDVALRATGNRAASSTGTAVTLDGFVGDALVDDTRPKVGYGSWQGILDAAAAGGTVRRSSRTGATTTLTFRGGAASWLTQTGPGRGIAEVVLDGRTVATVDTYAPTRGWVTRTVRATAVGRHTVGIVVTGRRNPDATGAAVVVDALRTS